MFNPQPVLVGPSLSVRPLRQGDFEALYAVARDPLVWAQHPASNRHLRCVFEHFFDDAIDSGGALAIVAGEDEVIGSSRFHAYDEQLSEVEIGWTFLARSYWGGGANREVKQLMLEHAFRSVRRVVFLVGAENHRSQRALEKIGAERAGTRVDGSGQQSLLFEIRRENWHGG